mmetsp:Transcript_19341/g.34441  ORF Transcript_19341/g.34441 Transcript_19341/m.34441 type:complete len:334 (-) Transcript_19341:332-1333(-)
MRCGRSSVPSSRVPCRGLKRRTPSCESATPCMPTILSVLSCWLRSCPRRARGPPNRCASVSWSSILFLLVALAAEQKLRSRWTRTWTTWSTSPLRRRSSSWSSKCQGPNLQLPRTAVRRRARRTARPTGRRLRCSRRTWNACWMPPSTTPRAPSPGRRRRASLELLEVHPWILTWILRWSLRLCWKSPRLQALLARLQLRQPRCQRQRHRACLPQRCSLLHLEALDNSRWSWRICWMRHSLPLLLPPHRRPPLRHRREQWRRSDSPRQLTAWSSTSSGFSTRLRSLVWDPLRRRQPLQELKEQVSRGHRRWAHRRRMRPTVWSWTWRDSWMSP